MYIYIFSTYIYIYIYIHVYIYVYIFSSTPRDRNQPLKPWCKDLGAHLGIGETQYICIHIARNKAI